MSSGVGVELRDVSRRFGRVQALDRVSFDVRPGEVLGLLGPNGAGKTTTMRVITGFLRPDSGTLRIGDTDPGRDPVGARRLVGYLPESAPVPRELSVRAYLSYCARLRRLPRTARRSAVGAAIDQAGLERVSGRVIGTLSKGYRQRVALAQALVHDPPVLILDEPTAGLDPRQVAETRALIGKLGRRRAVLLSSHLLAEVSALCKRVVVIDGGQVVATRPVQELSAAVQGQRLDVRLSGDAEAAARLVRNLAGVTAVEVIGSRLVVRGSGQGLAESVSAAVVGAGLGLLELRVDAETLEEAYLRLVRP